jgi:hypothetical protein
MGSRVQEFEGLWVCGFEGLRENKKSDPLNTGAVTPCGVTYFFASDDHLFLQIIILDKIARL